MTSHAAFYKAARLARSLDTKSAEAISPGAHAMQPIVAMQTNPP